MNTDAIEARFDTYNAKWLTPDEVAQSFVPPPQFATISKRRNSLIVGPRGSGKTTLLKMLTKSALDRWRASGAPESTVSIEYSGVFVATDVSWNFQVTSLAAQNLDPSLKHALQWAALTTHTHKSLVDAMESRAASLRHSVRDDHNALEAALVSEISGMWRIQPRVPSFMSLRSALRERLQNVYEWAMSRGDGDYRSKPAIDLPLLVSCRSAVEFFNDAVDDRGHWWAFLFDEVELMPTALREELYCFLRTFPGPMVFKLALSPFDDELPQLHSAASPQRDADYDFVPLWYPRKRAAYQFCRVLWDAMVRGTRLEGKRPQEVLGQSLLDTKSEDWRSRGTAYTRNSSHFRYLNELRQSDEGFKRYLDFHGIQLEAIESVKSTARASTLRKVFPLVVARVEMRRMGRDKAAFRSRKVSNLYTGTTSIFDISEGNPRRFIGLVSRMLERLPSGETRLDQTVQAQEITQAAARYRALLRTIVIPDVTPSDFRKGLLSLLDPVGRRLQEWALVEEFSPEPPGTFIVDLRTNDQILRLIGYALNTGAIVHVPDRAGEEQLLSSDQVRGKKFRLSYLLAAHYGIPPRLGRHASLQELLRAPRDDDEELLFGAASR